MSLTHLQSVLLMAITQILNSRPDVIFPFPVQKPPAASQYPHTKAELGSFESAALNHTVSTYFPKHPSVLKDTPLTDILRFFQMCLCFYAQYFSSACTALALQPFEGAGLLFPFFLAGPFAMTPLRRLHFQYFNSSSP